MSRLYHFKDHLMLLATYGMPSEHSHLASHIIFSLGAPMEWKVGDTKVNCYGICIGPGITHTGTMPKEGTLVFLFTETSRYAESFKERYLKGAPYQIIGEKETARIIDTYDTYKESPDQLSQRILEQCGLEKKEGIRYDSRVEAAIAYMEDAASIEPGIYDELSRKTCLSKSRLSHLFHEQTNMTLHSVLALEKLLKTSKYIQQGMNITDASVSAGFYSPSHCAATCRRMFGISMRELYRSLDS